MLERECDEVLRFLLNNPKNSDDGFRWWYQTLRPKLNSIDDADFENVILILYSDKNIESDANKTPTPNIAPVIYFQLTIAGKLLILKGGYIERLNHQKSESTRLGKMEAQTYFLTKILAYATLALVLVEVVRLWVEHSPFSFCH